MELYITNTDSDSYLYSSISGSSNSQQPNLNWPLIYSISFLLIMLSCIDHNSFYWNSINHPLCTFTIYLLYDITNNSMSTNRCLHCIGLYYLILSYNIVIHLSSNLSFHLSLISHPLILYFYIISITEGLINYGCKGSDCFVGTINRITHFPISIYWIGLVDWSLNLNHLWNSHDCYVLWSSLFLFSMIIRSFHNKCSINRTVSNDWRSWILFDSNPIYKTISFINLSPDSILFHQIIFYPWMN